MKIYRPLYLTSIFLNPNYHTHPERYNLFNECRYLEDLGLYFVKRNKVYYDSFRLGDWKTIHELYKPFKYLSGEHFV